MRYDEQFSGANVVFKRIVCIDLLDAEYGIGIPFPSAAQVNGGIDSSDGVTARNRQTDGIIFSVTDIGESYFSEKRRVECARRPETVYAKSVVVPVLIRPFSMGDYSGRQRIQIEVRHPVRADHHSVMSFLKFIDDPL